MGASLQDAERTPGTSKPEVRGYGRRRFAWGLPGSDRELRILEGVQMYSAMC